MVVNVFGENVMATEGIKEAAKREAKKFERYLKPDTYVAFTISVVGETHKAAISIPSEGRFATVKNEDGDMYAAIGKAADIMERALRKDKEKTIQRHRTAKTHPLSPDDVYDDREDDADEEDFVDSAENMPFCSESMESS